mmetsp:Transcript_50481/g.131159  ORF Transcript_50481/g.131159 Transcript_50481/m.131159 type:complete len:204 (-) Transcript_50481:138-749(-)
MDHTQSPREQGLVGQSQLHGRGRRQAVKLGSHRSGVLPDQRQRPGQVRHLRAGPGGWPEALGAPPVRESRHGGAAAPVLLHADALADHPGGDRQHGPVHLDRRAHRPRPQGRGGLRRQRSQALALLRVPGRRQLHRRPPHGLGPRLGGESGVAGRPATALPGGFPQDGAGLLLLHRSHGYVERLMNLGILGSSLLAQSDKGEP